MTRVILSLACQDVHKYHRGLNLTGETPVQSGVGLCIWGISWVVEAIQELGCRNHQPRLRKRLLLIPSRYSTINELIPPWESSMSGLIHHNPCLGLRHDWDQNLMSQHNSKHKDPSRAH